MMELSENAEFFFIQLNELVTAIGMCNKLFTKGAVFLSHKVTTMVSKDLPS